MLALLSAFLGFGSSFLPKAFDLAGRWMDHKQELELTRLRIEAGRQEHLWRMEEIEARADIEEARELHKPQPSYGVQFLDALTKSDMSRWLYVPLVYLFAVMDFASGMVRSTVTYAVVAGYLAYKWARFELLRSASDASFTAAQGIAGVWDENDYAVLSLVLGFWFGQRMYKAVFGGNAAHGAAGK